MATIITQIDPNSFQLQTYQSSQVSLIPQFSLDTFLGTNSKIEFIVLDVNKNVLTSVFDFKEYTLPTNFNNQPGVISNLILDPEKSLFDRGYNIGQYITYYNFLTPKIGTTPNSLFISEISSDRTELRLDSTELDLLGIIEQTTLFVRERENSPYFIDFYLGFGDNQYIIANNIQLDDQDINNPTILVKLYEPLPFNFNVNSTLYITTFLEDPLAYQVDFQDEPIQVVDSIQIGGPNFNLPLKDQINNSTLPLSFSDLISTSLTSSVNQINSLLEEKEIDINVDYTNFSNFVHFSSAQTRLENFYYKVGLIEQYSSSIALLNSTTSSPTEISSSKAVYEAKINNLITNFDGYEYFLYYDNSQYSWPKTTSVQPYELAKIGSTQVNFWFGSLNENSPIYGGIILSASTYDNNNKDNLLFSIPEYLRDDSDNEPYELFVSMVGQHYDNIWIYYKDITNKYNADNRLYYGISNDIVADAIRDFGVKLYQNNFSNEDLYTAFLGLTPEGGLFPFPNITGSLPTPSGFEYVDVLISASNNYMPLDDVNKSLYKRIYHNIPYLLKTKGTLPGLRALITSYGVPDTILRINEYGGKDKVNTNDWDYWQNEFNYAFNTSGSNFISSSWSLNTSWNAPNDVPATLMFRFKTEGLSQTNIPYSQSLWYGDGGSAVTLTYTGSAYISGSHSGSIIDPYYQYAHLTFFPDTSISTQTASVYLPFYDGGWWSVMVTKNSDTYTLYSQNKIYEGGDNGTILGFKESSSVTFTSPNWNNTFTSYFPVSFSALNSTGYDIASYDVDIYDGTGSLFGSYIPFSGSYQEIRYYTVPINENVFVDYTMNPHSIEGNSLNSAPNELAFRASVGGEQYIAPISIHPKVTGSWITTHSFASDSDFYYDATPNFIPNREYTFADQPVAGIRNTISDKIRIENNVMPEGDTLSPFMALSQMANVSQSYTQNINYLEVAFSPTNEINEDIVDQLGYFNIGEYIGDPRQRFDLYNTYPDLDRLRNDYFEKYTKNYNLTDFIRLIKFFDNSLFKMIRDFVPARTSLASGIVIKQHLLERNKYPQPQMEWEDLDISGTLKPQWNDYEPGTVEHFEGGAGGVVNPFNYLNNTSQSWNETFDTPLGTVLMLHDDQDEFYNGEYSGSTIIVSNGVLNEPYPLNIQSFNYKQVHYYGTSSFEDSIFENNFLNSKTAPKSGEILFFNKKTSTVIPLFPPSPPITISFYATKYLKIAKVDCSGSENNVALENLNKVLIYNSISSSYTEYDLELLNEKSTYYLYGTTKFYNSSSLPNQVLDYYTLSLLSNSYQFPPGRNQMIIDSWNVEFGDTLSYFDTSSGILTFGNTPNTPISITASLSTSGSIPIFGKVSLTQLRNGVESSLSSKFHDLNTLTYSSLSSSVYPIQGDQYYLKLTRGLYYSGFVDIVSGIFEVTQSRAVITSSCDPVVIFEPYVSFPNFYNSDENALLNNVEDNRLSQNFQKVDYVTNLLTPTNFTQIINDNAQKAAVQDSNYTLKRNIIPRYEGSKSTSQKINKWTKGDTGTFGKIPTAENLKSYVAYGEMGGSWAPEKMNASSFQIKYLIDETGNIVTPNLSPNSLQNTQGTFITGERFKINSTIPGSGEATEYRKVIRGGARLEPILYTQSGSTPGAQWNTTMSFEDIVPSDAGNVGNYTALFNKTTTNTVTSPNTNLLITFNNAMYGNTYLFSDGYKIPSPAVQDGVNLTFNVQLNVRPEIDLNGTFYPVYGNDIEVLLYNTITNTVTNQQIFQVPSTYLVNYSFTLNSSQLQANDVYKVYIKYYNTSQGNAYQFPLFGSFVINQITRLRVLPSITSLKVTQYPLYTQPITSSGINSIWGYVDTTNYPYVITSSNQTLVELYDSNVRQIDISGSGFNSIALPWSIKYADEFRFEGREDFAYQVGKIFGPAESGSGRITQTGSIEVHFNADLPVSASPSVFNLDHFLIRRYVDDASQIVFEGFKPINSVGPYIISPEYIISELDKNIDVFVADLTQKGLL
jgi:hypothetical protein